MSTATLNSAATQFLPLDPSSSDWKDVTPVYQQDGNNPLCPILYDTKCEYRYYSDNDLASDQHLFTSHYFFSDSSSMDLLRSFLSSPEPERSPRALALTEHLIRLNASNYTVWHYRAYILLGSEALNSSHALFQLSQSILNDQNPLLKKTLEEELDFIEILANENMKGYQVWQHRRLILTALSDPSKELSFIEKGLERDSKNYHTWVYRQWVLSYFGGIPTTSGGEKKDGESINSNQCSKLYPEVWDGELDYVERLLTEDIRNNSAWSHRYFVLFSSGRAKAGEGIGCEGGEKETALREIE